ncbi:DnaB-like helicase N-terminal domain-containing protein [Streptomyces sp. NPDC050263]|uniref:DnaB-like helicase N-terminal domain-containing protein n=1 Tax=Streptomyces sp. NPDC050263 TaxID=3155037 RepID=UPI003444A0FF
MPHTHTPDPHDDDGLDRVPAQKPVHYAEQALLGALLLEPARLADAEPLIAHHFDSHTHATLFTAIRTLPPPDHADHADHAKNTARLNAALDHAHPHARGLSASSLHALIQFCPQPKHAAAYARMIRADNARRILRGHAERLASTATTRACPTQQPPGSAWPTASAASWTPSPNSSLRTPAPSPARHSPGCLPGIRGVRGRGCGRGRHRGRRLLWSVGGWFPAKDPTGLFSTPVANSICFAYS